MIDAEIRVFQHNPSTPAVPFAQIRPFAATQRTGQCDPGSPIFVPRDVGFANRAPDAHIDAMLGIENDYFAEAQSGTGEYGLS